MSEIGDNQVSHQCVGKGQQGIKPLPLLSFILIFPSLRLGEMLAQYLNGPAFYDAEWASASALPRSTAQGSTRALKHRCQSELLSKVSWEFPPPVLMRSLSCHSLSSESARGIENAMGGESAVGWRERRHWPDSRNSPSVKILNL